MFTLPSPTIETLLSDDWQNARCDVYTMPSPAGITYAIAYSFPTQSQWTHGYSQPVERQHGCGHFLPATSFADAQRLAGHGISPLFALQGVEAFEFLQHVNKGASLQDWTDSLTSPLTNDHHVTPTDIDRSGHVAAFRLRSEQTLHQRYWLRYENGVLHLADRRRAVAVTDVLPLPFTQFACQVAVTEDGVHRVAVLYEVNGVAVTVANLLPYLDAVAQYGVPVVAYKSLSPRGAARTARFRNWVAHLFVQANDKQQWASAVYA